MNPMTIHTMAQPREVQEACLASNMFGMDKYGYSKKLFTYVAQYMRRLLNILFARKIIHHG